MKRQHLCMMAVSLIMAICMCLGLAACDTSSTGNTHTHSYTYTDNGNGTHNGTCTADGDCDAKNITNQSHTYGTNDECVCGAKKPTDPTHTHSYTYTDNGNGTHNGTCTADGDCDAKNITNQSHTYGENDECVCGAKKPINPDVHGHVYNWVDNGDGTHTGTCTVTEGTCGNPTISDEKHDFVNGVCSKCEAEEPEEEIMTHAEYMAAAKDDKVLVSGVVTALRGKNVYFQDNDGGYYLYGAGKNDTTVIPNDLAVGMEVSVSGTKAIYNNLHEITNATVTVTNATPATVNPVEITADLSNEDVSAMQNTYVVLKNVEVTATATGATLKLGDKTYTYHVAGTSQVVTEEQQTAIKAAFAAADGKTADVTAIVSLYQGNAQLVPASATPLLTVYTKLTTPVLALDENTGAVTWDKDTNASKYAYKIGDGEVNYIENDAAASVTIEDGETITVWAVGEGAYLNSAEATATYTKIKLTPAPAVTATGTGVKWTAVPNASGYGYEITPAEGEKKTGTTTELSIKLDNGDSIIVWALGTGKYKDSDPSASVTYAYTEVQIDEPEFTIDRNGKVTIAKHHDTESFKYVTGTKADLEAAYLAETLGDIAVDVTGEIVLTSGQAIALIAVGNGLNLLDSDWTVPEEYKAPAGAFAAIDADDVEITLNATSGKVNVVWLHDGETFEIVVDGVAATLDDSQTVLDFKSYTEIKIKALATTEPAEGSYDYSGCHGDSEYLDITTAFNTFVANEKIKIANAKIETEKAALTLDTKVQTNKEITLPAAGATHSDVAIAWAVKGGNTDIAKIEGGKLTITPTTTETTVTIVASLTCDVVTTPVEKELTITVKLLETVSETFTFSSANNVTGAVVSIAFAKGANTSSAPAYNAGDFSSTGSVRVYAKNTITVNGNGKTIAKIVITYMQDTADNKVTANIGTYTQNTTGTGTATDPLVGTWVGEAESVVFTVGGASKHIRVKSIEVYYEKPSDEELVDAAIKAMENFKFAEQYADNFLVDETVNGLPISWSATPNTGHGSISFSETAENGKYTAIIDPSTASEVEVTLTASVTSGEVTKQATFTVKLAKKVPATITAKPGVNVDENGNVTWTAVENATGYAYQLKTADTEWTNGTETIAYDEETGLYSVPTALTDGQTIRVKAVGDGYNYSESGWTEKTYSLDGPVHDHNYEWVNNGDGTHKQHCDVEGCEEPDKNAGAHVYDQADNKCVCGAVEAKETTLLSLDTANADDKATYKSYTNQYNASFTAQKDGITLTFKQISNGTSTSIYDDLRCGKITTAPSIESTAFSGTVTKISFNVSKFGAGTKASVVLVVKQEGQETPVYTSSSISITKTGEVIIEIPEEFQGKGYSYTLNFTTTITSNGNLRIDKIIYSGYAA